ncbi:MAG: HD-GYP domain-containing protein [Clostridiales bacterium]|nr:HD-GYP domain-containing protein [Clostridiales bacterium]MCF8021648.1 HD-GYP domain-containing protein [Clostridiales bacterium]
MRRISINSVQPGMKLGHTIYNSNGQVLLNTGVILNKKYINKLKDLGIPLLYIDDGLLSDVKVDDVVSQEVRVEVTQKIKKFFQDANTGTTTSNLIGVKELGKDINSIIDQLLGSEEVVYDLMDIRLLDEYTFGHSVNVCLLALITGIHLGYSRTKLFHLGMGALLHDVGKTKIPQSILNKPDKLTDEEFNEIKKHPEYGYEVLINKPNVSRLSSIIALQHHEKENGNGYPYGIAGDEIHEMAKITGLVDMYDALTSDRVYRKAFFPHEAYKMLLASAGNFYDANLVNSFLQHVAAYPVGTMVILNSGQTAAVVENRSSKTTVPKVRLLFTSEGEVVTDIEEFWLNNNMYIEKVISDEEELINLRNNISKPL